MKLKMTHLVLAAALAAGPIRAAEPPSLLTLDEALQRAERHNPELASAQARVEAENALVPSQYAPSNPRLGWMHENNLTADQQLMGPMDSWTITQEILFPTKYFLMGSAQKHRTRAASEETQDLRLEIRQKVVSAYYNLYSTQKRLSLLEAQRETLREIARIAEARRATGAVPQQDEMKAHVEQTKLETDILMMSQERDEAEATLNALMDQDAHKHWNLAQEDLHAPRLSVPAAKLTELSVASSKMVSSSRAMLEEARTMETSASWNYAPDFMLNYRKAYKNAASDAYSFSVEMTIPLWFFARQAPEARAAGLKAVQAEHTLTKVERNTQAEIRSLGSKVKSLESLLQIYETSLVPQATSTLNSSRAAYGAGRTGFMELLDSERSLFEVRIAYYQTLSRFIDSLAMLEKISGLSLSSLPFPSIPQESQ